MAENMQGRVQLPARQWGSKRCCLACLVQQAACMYPARYAKAAKLACWTHQQGDLQMRLPSEDARCLPSEGQMPIGPSCACLQKTKTSLAVGPIMVGFFLFVVVGSGERSLHAESLPTAYGASSVST